MASLFLSHSSRDREVAERLLARLRQEGFAALFLDFDPEQGVPAGREWEPELYSQLRRSDAVVFLGSADANASRWCFAELALARSLGKPIIPVRLNGAAIPPLLDDVQWVDLADGEPAIARLVAGLRRAGVDPADSFAWDPNRSPYPGLGSFAPEDAAVFFGRDQEIDRLLELLQPTLRHGRGRFVAVVGPSGSGKSSLVHAGLLPRLDAGWLVVPPFVPGSRPIEHLADSLARAFAAHGEPRPRAELEVERLADIARELARPREGTRNVLVVVDQAEELLTRTGESEQQAFLATLREALHENSPLWCVATVRSEFLSGRPERAGLAEAIDDSLVIEPLSRSRLAEVIERPAARAGVELEAGLAERMVQETTGGDALPLLAYTLHELYREVGPDGHITIAEYEGAGGVVGALRHRADRLLDELGRRGQGDSVIPTLLKLAAVEAGSGPTRRRVARDALAADERAVVDAFVDARLLTSRGAPGEETTIEVAHEALLRQWPPLQEAIEGARSWLQLRSELERLAADWDREGRDESFLVRGARLGAFDAWAIEHPGQVEPLERAFLDASRRLAVREIEAARRSNRRLRILAGGLGVMLVAALVASVLAIHNNRQAQSEARLAWSRQLASEADRLVGREPDVAILVGLQSLSLGRNQDPAVPIPSALITGLSRVTHASALLTAHTDQVHEVAFSHDGGLLASASWDGTVRLWDVRSRSERGRALRAEGSRLTSVVFSRRDDLLAAGDIDGVLRVWGVRSRRPEGDPINADPKGVNAVAFSSSGDRLASAGEDGTVRLWDIPSGRARGTLRGHDGPVQDVEYSSDGSLIASAGTDRTVRLWDAATGEPRGRPLRGHRDQAWGVAFNRDGTLLASTDRDKFVRLWSVPSGEPRGVLKGHRNSVWDASFTPDGSHLVTASADRSIRLWDVASGRLAEQPLTGHTNTVGDVDISPDGKLIASAGWDGTVRVWDVAETPSVSHALTGHDGEVFAVQARPDGKALASAGLDGTVRLWDLPEGRPLAGPSTGHDGEANAIAFGADGTRLASGGGDGFGLVWDAASGRPRPATRVRHGPPVWGVAIAPDGSLLATAGEDGLTRLWDVPSGGPRGRPLAGHEEAVLGVAISPDGEFLATASADHTAIIRRIDSGEPVGRPLRGHNDGVTAVAFSPRGGLLATASYDGKVRLWDAASGEPRGQPISGHTGGVLSVAFSPDGRRLATASEDGTARLWEVPSGRAVRPPLSGHLGPVYSVSFLRGPWPIATAGADGTIRLWKPSFTDLVASGCGLVGRNLSMAEWDLVARGLSYERTCEEFGSGPGAPSDAPAARY
jgi:WD40 repeat protein